MTSPLTFPGVIVVRGADTREEGDCGHVGCGASAVWIIELFVRKPVFLNVYEDKPDAANTACTSHLTAMLGHYALLSRTTPNQSNPG